MTAKKMKREFNKDMLDSVVSALDNLPENPPDRALSAREMVLATADKIRIRLNAGYTYQQIVETLASAGFNISVGTLKTYLSVATRQQKQHRVKKKTTQETKQNDQVTLPTKRATTKAQTSTKPGFQDPDEK